MSIERYRQLCSELTVVEFSRRRQWPLLIHSALSHGPLKPLRTRDRTIDRLMVEEGNAHEAGHGVDPYTVFELVPADASADRVSIGSAWYCDVQVNDVSVSGLHVWLLRHGGGYALQDSESAAGTFVNDEMLDAGVLRPVVSGDRISFGTVEVLFLLPAEFHAHVSRLPGP